MPRIALISALLVALAGWTTAWAQTNAGYPTNWSQPGRGPSTPDGWFPQGGTCYQPMPYQSPLETTYVTTDVVAFRRDWQASQSFATLNTPTNGVLGTHDLDFVNQPGLRVLAGRRFNDCLAIEASFLGLLQWDETRAVRDLTVNSQGTAGNLFSPLTNFGRPAQVGLDFNTSASIRILSQFNGGELNLRQRLNTTPSIMQASALYGIRYLNAHERLEYRTRSLSPAPVGTDNAVDVVARNSMFGVQIGGAVEFRVEPRCWLSFEAKGIMLGNDAGQQTQYTVGPIGGPSATINGQHAQERVAFATDLAATAVWKFTPAIVGRVGYQGILVDGLALASDNFTRNAPFMTTAPTQISNSGHLAFHGPFTGVTVTW
jgi:hypothetical protein